MCMKLSEWAKEKGIHYQTAWKWFKAGKIDGAYRSKTGSVFVDKDEDELKLQLKTYQRLYEASLSNEEKLKLQLKKYQEKYEKL